MKSTGRIAGTIVLILAVMGYTVWNYANGKTELDMFLVSMVVLCLPLVNMAKILLREWKNRD